MTASLLSSKPVLRLGELLCAAGLARAEHIDAALALQRASGEQLGASLVRQSLVDAKDTAAAIMVQQRLRERLQQETGKLQHALPECLRLGELLVARGDVSQEVLAQALAKQPDGMRLGDILLQMGAINTNTLAHVLPLQKRLLSAVLRAGLGFAFAFATQSATGGETAQLTISATVAKSIRVAQLTEPSNFTVTKEDILRGYIDLVQPSVLDITTNSRDGIALEFHGSESEAGLRAVRVVGGSAEFEMPASGGIMLLQGPWHPNVARNFRLSYRLMLGPNAQVGFYPWPITLGVSAL